MEKKIRRPHTQLRHCIQVLVLASLAVLLPGCAPDYIAPANTGTPYMFDARGEAAENIAQLWWLMFALSIGVFALVLFPMALILIKGRRPPDKAVDLDTPGGHGWILGGGVLLPAVVLTILLIASFRSLSALAAPPAEEPIRIDVVGNQWWWEVRYPDYEFITANEIHIPVGQPVQVNVTSADVIHSFWVPQIAGKIDLIPGKTNFIHLEAEEPGVYRGMCAEFCGLQHAKMALILVAEESDDFLAWVEDQQAAAVQPQTEAAQAGLRVFLASGCAACHTVRGLGAAGEIGPDLTHLASRLTIGAGTLRNSRGNLGGWVVDPHSVKRGVYMPPNDMSASDLQALLDFLYSLE